MVRLFVCLACTVYDNRRAYCPMANYRLPVKLLVRAPVNVAS
jgi:hypothetical protein